MVTRYPGFSPNVVVMALEDVDAVELVKFFVGHGIQVSVCVKGREGKDRQSDKDKDTR